MNSLWLRLTLAFVCVALIGFGTAAWLANQQVDVQFRGYLAHSQLLDTGLPEDLADFYVRTGSWTGVDSILETVRGSGMMGMGRGMRRGGATLLVADTQGRVVNGNSETLSAAQLKDAIPIEVQGQPVGYLWVTTPAGVDMSAQAQTFLAGVNRALVQAGLVAGLVGLALGVFMARGLAAPLTELAHAARKLAAGELSHRVRERGTDEVVTVAQAFNAMAAHLQQAEVLRRNMVADIAHELRTPLTVMQGNLRAILDDVYPLDKSEIATIYDETLILNRLISDLRELSQAEAGQLALNPQPVNMGDVVISEVSRFTEQAQASTIEFTADVAPDLPMIQADADRVRQVLHNLLTNSLRYTPIGGKVYLTVEAVDNRQGVRVTVSDTGVGIAPDDVAHVFDRFWRADKSRGRAGGGTGLGLAIARQLVEAHGGQMGVTSRVGAGSQFWFVLPKEMRHAS